MGTEYPNAIDYWVDRARVFAVQNSRSAIVLHCTGGVAHQTAQQLGDYFRTNEFSTSSHFGIDRSGVVAQYVRLADGAAANCCVEAGYDPFWDRFLGANLNPHTISIECVNDISNSLPLTEPQKAALFKLVAWLCERYELGPDRIKTHQSIAPGSRARCPGPAFPLAELIEFIKSGGATMGVPTGWTDDGTTLTAPNGYRFILGFRQHVLSHNWDTQNVPLENEHSANPVERYYQSTKGVIQTCRFCRLAWTPERGVYVMGIGNELLGAEAKIAEQAGTIATLKQDIEALKSAPGRIAPATIAAIRSNVATLELSLKNGMAIVGEIDEALKGQG